MKSGLLFLAIALAASAVAADNPAGKPTGKKDKSGKDLPEVQAQLLDHNEYLCDNCFFGASTYYYCFEADHKVLIGYEKIPTMNWKDDKRNDLVKVHKSWAPLSTEEQTIQLRYNNDYIFINRAGMKKPIRLTQDYTTDIFVNNNECRKVVKKKAE